MKYLKYLLCGIFFGIIMVKGELISWYRIFEMFHFDAFHMYGVIGSAVILGASVIYLIKRSKAKTIDGEEIVIPDKERTYLRYIVGGSIFGLGWALIGACPGPLFVLVGYGCFSILIAIIGALLGTLIYGYLRDKLPH